MDGHRERKMKTTKCDEGSKGRQPDRYFINEQGRECVEVEFDDGQKLILKIVNPRDPIFQQMRDDLADLPPLNLDTMISELRD